MWLRRSARWTLADNGELAEASVAELERRRVLLVEDGNHGEYRPRADEFSADGTAFIRASDMEYGRVLFASASRINDAALARIRKGIGRPGDVLFSHKGTVGKLALAPDEAPPFVCSPQTTFWRTLDTAVLDRRFLYFWMQGDQFREQTDAVKGQTDMADYVSLTDQRRIRVALPPIAEQRAIAEVLGALDDKVELNRQMNHTLEEMASALFKSWFVGFDPIVAKVDGRTLFGVDAATAALFPSAFVADPTWGDIPKGWSTLPLDEVADFRNGLALQNFRPGIGEDRLPVIKIAQLRTGRPDGDEWARANIDPTCILEDGDIVFSWSGSLAVVVWCGGKGALNQHLFKVTSAKYPKWFFHQWTLFHLPEFQGIAADKATTMGHIRRFHLTEARCVVPPAHVLAAADRRMSPWLDLLIANELESRTLTTLRDTLLPKLLSGEVRLKQAEKLVEAAL